jgi:cytochrome c oxidase subunit 3
MTGATLHKDYAGAKLGMWLFLFTELMLFGGLFILYAVYFSRYPSGFSSAARELSLLYGTVNTAVLLTSSMLAAMALTAVQKDRPRLAEPLLAGTVASAGLFLGIKYLEWSAKIGHGIYPGSPKSAADGEAVFFSLYYLTTGLHGLHVLIGAGLLIWVTILVRENKIHKDNYVVLENSALYWHLVDLVWIFIFPLYYLIL